MPREKKSSLKNKNNCNDVGDEIMGPKGGKKRRTSNVNNNNNQNNNNINNNNHNINGKSLADMIPPQPMTPFGDTIFASNPFDDTPRTPVNPQTPQPLPPPNGPPGMLSLQQSMTSRPQQTNPSNPSPNNMIVTNNNVSMGPTGGPIGPKPVPIMSGKVYPPEQSMVFNPANPNAPPIYPCGVCHKEVHDNDQAILCESGCNFWYHRSCSGLSERAYFLLTQEVYAEWVCDNCANNKNIPLVKFKP